MIRFALALAVALLAAPALAAPLEFSDAPGPAQNIARTLMNEERGTPMPDADKISVAILDLDGDGTDEIFAFADASYFCGSAGCVPRLYRLDTSTMHWDQIAFDTDEVINGDPSMWSLGDRSANGWVTFLFKGPDHPITFAWTGKAYAPAE